MLRKGNLAVFDRYFVNMQLLCYAYSQADSKIIALCINFLIVIG